MNGMRGRGELRGVLEHALAPVGGDDAEDDVARHPPRGWRAQCCMAPG